MKITLERLRYKASFNKQGYEELPNGNTVNTNVKLFDFWFGYYKQSLSQSVSSNAFDFLKDKVTIIARHDDYFVQAMSDTSYTITLPKPNDKTYHVASINPDYEVNGYDTIVLSAVGATTSGSSD
ncbi:head-tail adaptor protein [Lactiplantibacillus plantarum]|nr:head-tail adaptor protein [Lactiplantibacillus plantarum]